MWQAHVCHKGMLTALGGRAESSEPLPATVHGPSRPGDCYVEVEKGARTKVLTYGATKWPMVRPSRRTSRRTRMVMKTVEGLGQRERFGTDKSPCPHLVLHIFGPGSSSW